MDNFIGTTPLLRKLKPIEGFRFPRKGDPKKAAQAIIQLTQERNPPLRLLLGSDAYAAVEKNDLARLIRGSTNMEGTQCLHRF